jgi:hypothetical protein
MQQRLPLLPVRVDEAEVMDCHFEEEAYPHCFVYRGNTPTGTLCHLSALLSYLSMKAMTVSGHREDLFGGEALRL